MDCTQGSRWDAVLAAAVAVASTTGLIWGLSKAMRPIWPTLAEEPARPIQVVWLPREEPQVPRVETAPARTRARVARDTPSPRPSVASPSTSSTATTAAPEPTRALSAVYVMQGRDALKDAAAPPDPFANRSVRLPGEGSERFRMRKPTSAASVVAGIGRMFGARDPDEPCREHRRNIGDLALDGDSRELQQQLEYERRYCRP